MRRRIRMLAICLLFFVILAIVGSTCFADSSSVSVSVTVPRSICVENSGVRSNPNVGVTTQVTGDLVTYIAL